MLAVLPQRQGEGVGRALTEACISLAREGGRSRRPSVIEQGLDNGDHVAHRHARRRSSGIGESFGSEA